MRISLAALICAHIPAIRFSEAVEVATEVLAARNQQVTLRVRLRAFISEEAHERAIDVLVDVAVPLHRSTSIVSLNVRDQPGTHGLILFTARPGQDLHVWRDLPNGWSFVTREAEGGWCANRYLARSS